MSPSGREGAQSKYTTLPLVIMPHTLYTPPLKVPDNYAKMFKFIDNHDQQYYHAMTNYLDDFVGELVSTLKDKGLWDNLLFIIRVQGYTVMTLPRTLGHGKRAKKHTVICGTPDFLGIVGARVCNRYQALFPPPSGPGYEAKMKVAIVII